MGYVNKIHLKVKMDLNGWFQFSKWKYRLQLCWDSSRDWFFLTQASKRLWKDNFMKDFTEILTDMEKNNESIFSLYELPETLHLTVE